MASFFTVSNNTIKRQILLEYTATTRAMDTEDTNYQWLRIVMSIGTGQKLTFAHLQQVYAYLLSPRFIQSWLRGDWGYVFDGGDSPTLDEPNVWKSTPADPLGLNDLLGTPSLPYSVSASDRESSGYIHRHDRMSPDGQEGDDLWADADDEDGGIEHDYRHPGDDPDGDDETTQCDNSDTFQAVTTVAAARVLGVVFAPSESSSADEVGMVRSFAPMQLAVRIETKRRMMMYDFFVWKPALIDTHSDEGLPTKRQMRKVEKLDRIEYGSDDDDDDDGDEEDEEDEELDERTQPPEGVSFSVEQRRALHLKCIAAELYDSRILRFRISLDLICGIYLHAPDCDRSACLILEFLAPPTASSDSSGSTFAVRKVNSPQRIDNKYRPCADWTPGQSASRASRHYIVGHVSELKELCAHLATVSTHIARLLAECTNAATATASSTSASTNPLNSLLRSGVSLEVAFAPGFVRLPEPGSLVSMAADAAVATGATTTSMLEQNYPLEVVVAVNAAMGKSDGDPSKKKRKLCDEATTEEVHQALREKCGVEEGKLCRVSNCLKRAMLLKYIDFTAEDFGRNTVVLEGGCSCCGKNLKATVGEILFQRDYAGLDYGDGGQNAPIQCRGGSGGDDDDDDDDVCCGNYVTNMCYGSPRFDSGKFHNHCVQCEKFGTCINDYRQQHCDVCGTHYFAGMMGRFACDGCGSKGFRRRGTAPQDMLLPGPEMMDGQLPGLDDALQMEERHRTQVTALQ